MAEPTRHVYHVGSHIVEMRDNGDALVFELVPAPGEKPSSMRICRAFEGVNVAFYEYNSPHCHVFNDMVIARDIVGAAPCPRRMLEVNVCREGTFRVFFPERQTFSSLVQGDLSLAVTDVSERARVPAGSAEADWVLDLPTSAYRGFGLIIDLDRALARSRAVLEAVGIDLSGLVDAYRLCEREFVMQAGLGLEHAVDAAERSFEDGETGLLRLSVLEVLARIAGRSVPEKSLERPECSLETARLVREARNHAVHALDQRYTIDALSRRFGMSATVFKAAFREIYGEPYARYMTRVRMERAEEMLAKGEFVLDAARATGYESPSKFTAAFKRSVGMSPSEYRKRLLTRS